MTDLKQKEVAVEFYENRYEEGYMEEWDDAKKHKIREILLRLPLPAKGRILDFGCGNGVFTRIIKDTLPDWEVYGVEISAVAVKNASKKNPDCTFFNGDDADQYSGIFDVLFSHHVIEHVQSLTDTFDIINRYLKPKAAQFHVLPCGNNDSLEKQICLLKPGGIKENNLFFFEEPGHLQRLNTEQFSALEKNIGFELKLDLYANQFYGAIDWITKSSPRFVKKLTDTTGITDSDALKKMQEWRKKLLPLTYQQFPYSKYLLIREKWNKSLMDRMKLAAIFLPALASKPTYNAVRAKAMKEWEQRKEERNGSEMFLFYSRN
ncbi:MAG: class I SAM-dependent methyltransferase [Chitinophagaceae bacterium]|nr:MAG: class I SAM-dependent methyltransferase [Chitinophagaceae bacterium]